MFSLATTASAVPGSSASDSNKPTFTGVGTGSEHVHFWGTGEKVTIRDGRSGVDKNGLRRTLSTQHNMSNTGMGTDVP